MTITINQLESRTTQLLGLLSNRYVDHGAVLAVCERSEEGVVYLTGERSRQYGGRWNLWTSSYDGPCDNPTVYKVSRKQFEILTSAIDSKIPHIICVGTRRAAKSETLALWVALRMLEYPFLPMTVLFKKHGKAKKFLQQKALPRLKRFLLPGSEGYRKSPDDYGLTLINGAKLEFLSAENVDSPRGDGVAAAGCDEKQIIPTEAWDNVCFSLSEAPNGEFQTLETGTALQGEFEDYFTKSQDDPGYHCHIMTAFDNCFIDKEFLLDLKKRVDPRRWAQEGEAKFVPQGNIVYHQFEKNTHVVDYSNIKSVLEKRYGKHKGEVGRDITRDVLDHWFNDPMDFLVGIDFNVAPMCSVIFKILQPPPGVPEIMMAIDEVIIEDRADATQLAIELKRREYFPAVCIPDASGAHSQGGKSSFRMLRDEGFRVYAPKKNPAIVDRVNAVNAKFLNAASQVTLFMDPRCKTTIKAMQNQKITDKGKVDKDNIWEHRADAFGYPIVYLYPASWGDK